MPAWFTLIGALFATVALLGGLYAFVISIVEARRAKASPRIGIAPGGRSGTLGVWVSWDPAAFAVQVYRIRFSLAHPYGQPQESMFSVSFDPVQKSPFQQIVELPSNWVELIEGKPNGHDAIITVDFHTVEELTLAKDYKLGAIRKVYSGKRGKAPVGVTQLSEARPDAATVMTLDFSEWNARKKKLKDLEAAAKAKAAAKPPAPAKPASAPTPAPTPGPSAAVVPSVKDVIAQENAKTKEAVKAPT
jgi:hypothetical protein